MEEKEATERQVDLLGQDKILPGLGEGDDLGVGGRSAGHFVSREWIAVHGVHAPIASDHLG